MREEDKGGEAVRGGVWIREGFLEEAAGGRLLECAEQVRHSSLTVRNAKALKTEGCLLSLLAGKFDWN